MTNKDVTLDNRFLPVSIFPVKRICDVKHRAPTSLWDSAEGKGKLLSNHKYPTQQPKENKATRQLNCTVYKWPLFFLSPPPPPPPLSPTSADLDSTRAFTTPLSSSSGWSQSPGFGRMGSSRHQVLQEHKPAFTGRASPNTDTTARSTNCCYLDCLDFVAAGLWQAGEKPSSKLPSNLKTSTTVHIVRGEKNKVKKQGMRHLNQRGKSAVLPGSSLCQRRILLKRVIAISISIDSHGRECSLGDFYSLTDHGNRKILLMLKLHTPSFSFGPLFLVTQLRAVCWCLLVIPKLPFLCRKWPLLITMFQNWGHTMDRYPPSIHGH